MFNLFSTSCSYLCNLYASCCYIKLYRRITLDTLSAKRRKYYERNEGGNKLPKPEADENATLLLKYFFLSEGTVTKMKRTTQRV